MFNTDYKETETFITNDNVNINKISLQEVFTLVQFWRQHRQRTVGLANSELQKTTVGNISVYRRLSISPIKSI